MTPRRERARADVHHVFVCDVRVGEYDLVDLVLANELLERGFRQDRDTFRIQRSRQLGGVAAAVMFGICVAVNATTSWAGLSR